VRGLENREGRLVFTMHLLPQNLDDEKITGKVTFRKGERDDTHNLSGFSSFFYVTVLAALWYHKFLFTKLSAPRKPLDLSMGVRRWRIYSPWFHCYA
jgi:hypothetical protein